jgi:hypothetical protein
MLPWHQKVPLQYIVILIGISPGNLKSGPQLDLKELMIICSQTATIKMTLKKEDSIMHNLRYYIPGTILILIATMIVAVLEILIAFVAASIIIAGIGALYIGHMIRKSEIEFSNSYRWSLDDDSYVWRFVRDPVFRRCENID